MGGNSTRISLYPQYKEDDFTFLLAGSSVSRTAETVKSYLALRKAGLPVCIEAGFILAGRLTGNEKTGIVPRGILPVCCENLFPGERIISFMNLGHKNWTRSFSTVLGSLYHISNCRCKIWNPAADVFHTLRRDSL